VKTRSETSAGGVVYRIGADDAFEVAIIRTHEGRWQLPKGWIEDGEAPETTAVREVREETGVEATVVGPLGAIDYTYVSRYDAEPARVRKRVHVFLLAYQSGSTDDHDHEVLEARFVPVGEALRMLAFRDEQRMVERARGALDAAASERADA